MIMSQILQTEKALLNELKLKKHSSGNFLCFA